MHPITEKKEQLKAKAKEIRALKQARKPSNENYTQNRAGEAKWAGREYRIEHIAYCLVRGRTYEQIEQPKEENKIMEYEWKKINNLYETLKAKVDEANEEWLRLHPKREVVNG